MKLFFRHFKFTVFGVSLLCMGLGAALLIWPGISQKVFCYAFGGVLVLCGLLQIASYLMAAEKVFVQKLLFAGGIATAVAGVWILFAPEKVLSLTVIVMGVVLLYHGVMDIKYAFDLKGCNGRWSVTLVFGLLTCTLGVLLLVNPFESLRLLFIICGVGLLFDGATDLFTVVEVARAQRRAELAEHVAEAIESGEVQDVPAAESEAGDTEAAAEPNAGDSSGETGA